MSREFESPFSSETYELDGNEEFFDEGEEFEDLGDEEDESVFVFEGEGFGEAYEDESAFDDEDFEFEGDAWDDVSSAVYESEGFDDSEYFDVATDGEIDAVEYEVIEDLEESTTSDSEHAMVESEIQVKRKLKVRANAATAPCHTVSPVAVSGDGRGREPRHRPGAGRRRRTRSRAYMKWVQASLNNLMQTNLKVDGIWGRNTARVVRRFQRMAKIGVDGKIGPETEGALIKFTSSRPPEREVPYEGLAPAAAAAAPALTAAGVAKAANIVIGFATFGFKLVKGITAGDLKYSGPGKAFGIRASNVPASFNLITKSTDSLIINFVETGPAERVNVKLRCNVQYDGLNLDANLTFDPGGRRSRLMRDTTIRVGDALELGKEDAPIEWRRCGISHYRYLRIPISYSVDRPWPLDNYHESFELVLSTMYGLGKTGSGKGRAHIQHPRVSNN